ncbi:glycosyltransferase [Ancylobacter terrae]|uniref:glycosyltransferase n=1 Tax=Ancylobacter sp. sgz301288 TaxID=3342077 RepID=UPI00385B4799
MAPAARTIFVSDVVLDFPHLGGVPEFAQRLLDGLAPIYGDRLVPLRQAAAELPGRNKAFAHPNYFVREAAMAGAVAKARPGGVFLFPNFSAPVGPAAGAHGVLNVVHDLQYKFLRQNFSLPGTVEGLDREFARTAAASDAVLFVSETTRAHFTRFFGPPRRGAVIHAPILVSAPADAPVPADEPPFLLSSSHMSDDHSHKNAPGVLRLFEGLAPRIEGLRLQLTGRGGPALDAHLARLAPELRARIVPLGFVSRGALDALYRRALAFVSLSYFEGFNLSAGEAATHRTPLILSHLPVHRELFGHGSGARSACFLDPRTPSAEVAADWLAAFPHAERAAPWPLADTCRPEAVAARVAAEIDRVAARP